MSYATHKTYTRVCTHCLQSDTDCDCARDFGLALRALGIDQPATLADVAQADLMEAQYRAAMLDRRIREGYHRLEQYNV